MNPKEIKLNLINAGNDIFYINTSESVLPETITITDKIYYRFCDLIFIPDTTENLTPEQVKIVNSIRAKFFENCPQFKINAIVKNYFLLLIKNWSPKNILEVGPHLNPLIISLDHEIKNLYLADFDQAVVEKLNQSGILCQNFSVDDKLVMSDNSVDFIFSIFVFQFHISDNQIKEFFRVLSENGVLIANIYKRNLTSKNDFKNKFIQNGFDHYSVIDPHNLCEGHEYWFFYKKVDENKLLEAKNILLRKL